MKIAFFLLLCGYILMVLYFSKKRYIELQFSLWLLIYGFLLIISLSYFSSDYIVYVLILFPIFYLFIIISKLQRQITRLVQEFGIMKFVIEESKPDIKEFKGD